MPKARYAKMRTIKRLLFIVVCCILFSLNAQAGDLTIEVLDVGQGLSVLFQSDDHYLLYDGGGREKSSYVVSYLKKKGITKLDYVIASHYDEDHISGLVGALNVFDCKTVLSPDYISDTVIYSSFVDAEYNSGAELIHPVRGETFPLGSSEVLVVGPNGYQESAENDNSIAIKVTDQSVSCLVCGDAENIAEEEMVASGLDLSADIYIVSHHGSGSSSSAAFVSQVDPEIAVISCGVDNSYGHPEAGVLQRLKDQGCEMLRTDKQNEIILWTDGEMIYSMQEPCTDWTPGSMVSDSSEKTDSILPAINDGNSTDNVTYVCNENTKKFHYPSCNSVSQMKEKNRRDTNQGRDELIAQGYDPCKNCKP